MLERRVAPRTKEYNITRLWARPPARDGETQQCVIVTERLKQEALAHSSWCKGESVPDATSAWMRWVVWRVQSVPMGTCAPSHRDEGAPLCALPWPSLNRAATDRVDRLVPVYLDMVTQ